MKCSAQWPVVSMHIPTGWPSLFIFINHNKQVVSKGMALQVAHQGPHPSSAASQELAKPHTPNLPLSQAECS